jgi:putative transposase
MTPPTSPNCAGHRFPAEITGHAVWLEFRFQLSVRMVDRLLAVRGIMVVLETVRRWALKMGQVLATLIRRRLPRAGDGWQFDEVVFEVARVKHWLWRAMDQSAMMLDILLQSLLDTRTAKRMPRKLLKKQMRSPGVVITDKLVSDGAPTTGLMLSVEHRTHNRLDNLARNSQEPTRRRERQMKRFKSAGQPQRFLFAYHGMSHFFPSPPLSSLRRPMSHRQDWRLPDVGRDHLCRRCLVMGAWPISLSASPGECPSMRRYGRPVDRRMERQPT